MAIQYRPVLVEVTINTTLQSHTDRLLADDFEHRGPNPEETQADIGDCVAECLHALDREHEVAILCHALLSKCIEDHKDPVTRFSLNDLLEELRQAANKYLTARERAQREETRKNQTPP